MRLHYKKPINQELEVELDPAIDRVIARWMTCLLSAALAAAMGWSRVSGRSRRCAQRESSALGVETAGDQGG